MLESFFDKIAGVQDCNFIKKSLKHRWFPVNFAKFLRTPFFYRTPPVSASDDNSEGLANVIAGYARSLKMKKSVKAFLKKMSKSKDPAPLTKKLEIIEKINF